MLNWQRSLLRHDREDVVEPDVLAEYAETASTAFHLAVGPSRDDPEDALQDAMLVGAIRHQFPTLAKLKPNEGVTVWAYWEDKVRNYLFGTEP